MMVSAISCLTIFGFDWPHNDWPHFLFKNLVFKNVQKDQFLPNTEYIGDLIKLSTGRERDSFNSLMRNNENCFSVTKYLHGHVNTKFMVNLPKTCLVLGLV